MFANLNYLLLIVLIVLKRHLVDGQENSHEHSYEEMGKRNFVEFQIEELLVLDPDYILEA